MATLFRHHMKEGKILKSFHTQQDKLDFITQGLWTYFIIKLPKV